jgi:hypothetical protein
MEQSINVVLLPTKDKTNVHCSKVKTAESIVYQLFYHSELLKCVNTGLLSGNQHVYITVSQDVEPIKEGDWCIHLMQNVHDDMDTTHVFQAGVISEYENRKTVNNTDKTFYFEYECRKIIATTDTKLYGAYNENIGSKVYSENYRIPQVQQSFLKEFVANPDGEYEVEYIKTFEAPDLYPSMQRSHIRPKLNQDNTVNITSVKEKMYSGIDLMGNQDGSFDHFLLHSSKFSQEEREVIMDAVYDWIKINT